MWGLGQHTLLGIVVGLLITKVCGASDNTLCWVLLLVYMESRAMHFTGYCCWVYVGPRVTHFTGYCCWVYVGPRATHFTGYCCWFMWGLGQHTLLGIVVEVSISVCISSETDKLATIRQISYSQTCTFPQSRPEDGNILVVYLILFYYYDENNMKIPEKMYVGPMYLRFLMTGFKHTFYLGQLVLRCALPIHALPIHK
jgi:hypothetical protein